MRAQVAAGLAMAAAAVVAAVTLAGDDAAGATAAVETPTPARRAVLGPRPAAPAPTPPEVGARRVIPLPGRGGDVSPGVRKWKLEGLPGTFREVVAPDGSDNLEERLTYRLRRLRFRLTDAAASCYDGGDGRESVALAYTLVVDGGRLRTADVAVVESSLSDKRLEACILDAVRRLEAPAPDLPPVRRAQQTVIGQHDLYVRTRAVD